MVLYSVLLGHFCSNLLALISLSSPEHHHQVDKPGGQSQGQEKRSLALLSTLAEKSNESLDDLLLSQFTRCSQEKVLVCSGTIETVCSTFHPLERIGRKV